MGSFVFTKCPITEIQSPKFSNLLVMSGKGPIKLNQKIDRHFPKIQIFLRPCKMALRYKTIRCISDEAHEERVKGLKNYKYNALDKSPISNYIMTPIWNFSVKLFPKWLAPNVITLMGLFLIIISLSLSLHYDFSCLGNAPSWVYFTHAGCLFLYMLCDAVDGKQARRTGSGSPLGQLFDHIVDSFVASITPVMLASAMGLGISVELILFVVNFKFCAFYANLEEFYTHKFVLGTVNGPTEGILSGIAVFLVAGFKGPKFFSFLLRRDIHQDYSNLAIFGVFMGVQVAVSTIFAICRDENVTDRAAVIFHALSPMTFYLTFFLISKQLNSPFKFYILLLCEMTNFSILILELIYANFGSLDIPIYSPTTIAFVLMLIVNYKDYQLYTLAVCSVLGLMIFLYAVFSEIAEILDIPIFTIPKKKEE